MYPNSINSDVYDYSHYYSYGIHNIFFNSDIKLHNRFISKIWNGDTEEGEQEEYVYVTKNGKVYHSSINCSYLKRSIKGISGSDLSNERNSSGGKYYPCDICIKSKKKLPIVYITVYGTAYHRLSNCSALVRDIERIPISEVGDRGKCTKCYQ